MPLLETLATLELMRRLRVILEDPQPDLVTWTNNREEAARDLRDELNRRIDGTD